MEASRKSKLVTDGDREAEAATTQGQDMKRAKNSAATTLSASEDASDTTSDSSGESEDTREARTQKMAAAMRTIIECMGEDADREGLQSTPLRAAKALQFFTSGYCMTVSEVVGAGVFNEETSDDMVVVRNIDIHSLCEHHMVPFSGKVHIAYIPQGKILGLSKLARIADLFSRRLQVQERLTRQIAQAIMDAISPLGVGVVIEASHMCMVRPLSPPPLHLSLHFSYAHQPAPLLPLPLNLPLR